MQSAPVLAVSDDSDGPTLETTAGSRRSARARARSQAPGPAEPDPFKVGEVVGGVYKILGTLGSGGYGTVYEADDLRLGRRAAIKMSRQSDAELQAEARALASFHHPGIAAVYGFGEHRGCPYIAMERLQGGTLQNRLDALAGVGRIMPVLEAIGLLLSIANILAVIHQRGLVHRDVKPSNVMLAPDGRVVLMDFGLFLPSAGVEGRPTGTAEYMAPEAIRGEPASAAVDIYGLGVTAYEMLTADVPFTYEQIVGTLEGQLMPDIVPLRDLRSDVPAVLAELVHEMIEPEPLSRPDTVAVGYRFRQIREAVHAKAANPSFRVLVVDDDPAVNKLLSVWVSKNLPGAEVLTASDGDEALDTIRTTPPDVLLLDLNMPRTSGVELCMVLRGMKLARDCMIVSVSAAAQPPDLELLRQLGITRFVPKGSTMLHDVLVHVFAQWENVMRTSAGT